MSRNRVFMNEARAKPTSEIELDMLERYDQMAGVRPLDGTNLAWIYNRKEAMNDDTKEPPLSPYEQALADEDAEIDAGEQPDILRDLDPAAKRVRRIRNMGDEERLQREQTKGTI